MVPLQRTQLHLGTRYRFQAVASDETLATADPAEEAACRVKHAGTPLGGFAKRAARPSRNRQAANLYPGPSHGRLSF